jgi:hypothetical protein
MKVYSLSMLITQAPMTAQLVVMRGRKDAQSGVEGRYALLQEHLHELHQ